mmetsp:Transcript_5453/g.8143  ORF Transcript_5453/g.8143 Transcript_5453/m.8143 type:complete len:242 (+) Transcript_5453:8-733(+)
MSAPPKPWEVGTSQPPQTTQSTPQATPQTTQSSLTQSSLAQNSLGPQGSLQSSLPLNSFSDSYPYRRSMPYRPMYSSMMRPGMYGMGSPYSMYGGMGGMGGMGGFGGMGGMGMSPYSQPSKGMIAIERFSMMVNSLCFTAETIEQSMHSMQVFWEALLRIKSWGADSVRAVIKLFGKRLKGLIQFFLYLIGRAKAPKYERVSVAKLLLNSLLAFILVQMVKFTWTEFTKPSFDEMVPSNFL